MLDHCQAGLAVTFIMGRDFLWCGIWTGMKQAQRPVKGFGLDVWLARVNRHENNIFAKFGLISTTLLFLSMNIGGHLFDAGVTAYRHS